MTDVFEVLEATWPPKSKEIIGNVTFRDGAGGGKRVSAASVSGEFSKNDLKDAEQVFASRRLPFLFSVKHMQEEKDSILAKNNYRVIDPTVLMQADIAELTTKPVPPVTAFPIWKPLQIMRDIWSDGGIGPERIAVMERVSGPKTGILGRINEKPGGTVFVAVHKGVAMVHALEIIPHQRRSGLGQHLMRAAAYWAKEHQAQTIALAVTRANTSALALYSSLGMREVASYHYRARND